MSIDLIQSLDLISSNGNELNDDLKSEKELEYFAENKNYKRATLKSLRSRRYATNTSLRTCLAVWSATIVTSWLVMVYIVLINNNEKYCLSDSVLNTLLTTTTIQVLGLVIIVMYDLFNGKSEDNNDTSDS